MNHTDRGAEFDCSRKHYWFSSEREFKYKLVHCFKRFVALRG